VTITISCQDLSYDAQSKKDKLVDRSAGDRTPPHRVIWHGSSCHERKAYVL